MRAKLFDFCLLLGVIALLYFLGQSAIEWAKWWQN